MPQDLLEDGGRATRFYPESSGRVAEEVGGDLEESEGKEKSRTSKEIRLSPSNGYEKPMI